MRVVSLLLIALGLFVPRVIGFWQRSLLRSSNVLFMSSSLKPINVLISGAGSSVGYEVFRKLLRRQKFKPFGLVRSKQDARKLIRLGATPEQVFIGDITDRQTLQGLFVGIDKVVLCTSARPRKTITYRVKNFFLSLIGRGRSPKVAELYYPKGSSPFLVDFMGQKNVIDEAIASSNDSLHFIMLSNMGGYRNGTKINEIGRTPNDPNSGNILRWKRAAERYLMKRAFFTIIHAGALTEQPGGKREVVWDNDDALLRTPYKKIPKEDCAEVLIQALQVKEAIGRSIDVATRGEGTGPTKDWLRFWSIPGNNLYPADLE
jgi:hypothetical protein